MGILDRDRYENNPNSEISIFSNQTIFIKHISKLNFPGILLFLVEIALLCWVKFYEVSHVVAWVATGMLIPIMIVFVAFAALFYLKLVAHKSEVNRIFLSNEGLSNFGPFLEKWPSETSKNAQMACF